MGAGCVAGAGVGTRVTGLGRLRLGGGRHTEVAVEVVVLVFGGVLSEVRSAGSVGRRGGVVEGGRLVPARGLTYGRGGT